MFLGDKNNHPFLHIPIPEFLIVVGNISAV